MLTMKKIKKDSFFILLTAVFVLSTVLPGSARQDDDSGKKLPVLNRSSTLADFIAYAALNSPELESAYYIWQAALSEIDQAGTLPDPVLSYGHYFKEVETKTGPQKMKFGIAQTLPWYGKRGLKEDIAVLNALAAEKKFEAKKQDLFYKVRKTWFELYFLEKALNTINESLEILEDMESSARNRFKTGNLSHASLTRLHIEQERLKNRVVSLTEQKSPLIVRLNSLLSRDIYEDIMVPAKVLVSELVYSFEQLAGFMEENSPVLAVIAEEEKKAALSVKLAGKHYYPDIKLGLSYIQTDDTDMDNVPDSGKDPVIGTVTFNLPIWFNKYSSAVDEAKHRHTAVRNQQEYIKNNLTADLKMVYFRFTDSLRKALLYENSIVPNAKEALLVLKAAFISNRADFAQLLDARQLLLELSLEYERAYTDCGLSLAELSRLTGIDVTRPGIFQIDGNHDK